VQVDSTSNAVMDLDVEFWEHVFGVHASLRDISHSCALHHVPHSEPLDCLVFRRAPRAVGAPHELGMATAMFVATAISSFLSLGRES